MTDKSGIICLVNVFPQDKKIRENKDTWWGAIFYYEGVGLQNFPEVLKSKDKSKDPECYRLPKTGLTTWEGGDHSTSLCNTICGSLLAVLSVRY